MTINLELKRFQREYYAEYVSWFADPELNRHLGPMEQAWLDAVLSQPESAGVTWAVFRSTELVAVVETIFDPERRLPAAITAIATKPSLRQQGIGTTVLQKILSLHKSKGIVEHVTYVSIHNSSGRRCVEKAGFVPVMAEPDERGYIEFRHYHPAHATAVIRSPVE
jgi:GNAT superfamily N-acetyltransferase